MVLASSGLWVLHLRNQPRTDNQKGKSHNQGGRKRSIVGFHSFHDINKNHRPLSKELD